MKAAFFLKQAARTHPFSQSTPKQIAVRAQISTIPREFEQLREPLRRRERTCHRGAQPVHLVVSYRFF
ncbi:MAG TPA: hypothetical protein VJU59_48215 [Paraburkholderia sp.]|uniref:hypothetical protein n=1 Tax=Paraburkholderia sp. TaxID=1926495 RepID=UPI002B4A67D0|nr:hypothetical protein [Paraburkholderia sp.]HKR47372.1 hypothetical protein [Paraburkholderia sp.]